MKPYVSHDVCVRKELKKDKRLACLYLNEALQDTDFRLFLVALKNVVAAYGGVSKLSKITKLNRQHLYRIMSNAGNPEFKSLEQILRALGFRITIEWKQKQAPKAKKAS